MAYKQAFDIPVWVVNMKNVIWAIWEVFNIV